MSDVHLPLASAPSTGESVRGDAARNREALMAAARRLVDRCGASNITMDALAEEAGVGKGTVFRRFGSRSGLMYALLDQSEKDFQQAVIAGPPPLGPGADAVERLVAFGRAALRLNELTGELQAEADHGGINGLAAPPKLFRRQHLAMLIRTSGTPGDPELLAFAMASALEPATLHYQLTDLGISMDRVAANWEDLARRTASRPV